MSTPNTFIEKYASHHEISYEKAEGEIVEALYEVARSVGPKFRFAFHSNEDMAQTAIVFAFEKFAKGSYDLGRPLRPFLKAVMHNELFNFKRNNFYRMEIPCRCCEIDTDKPCIKYERWQKRNALKRGLASPSSLDVDMASPSPCILSVFNTLKESVPHELWGALSDAVNGVLITKDDRYKLEEYLDQKGDEKNGD